MSVRAAALALVALSVALPLAAAPAAAQTLPQQPDEVTLALSAEAWVETKTAKVIAVVDATLTGDQAGAVRSDSLKALDILSEAADWQLTNFNRAQDASGLERWRITAEARLADTAMAGIADRAKAVSKPGLNVRVQTIDFSPTRAEREAVAAELRSDIYAAADAELRRLNAKLPERDFRIRRIDFAHGGVPRAVPRAEMRMQSMAMAADAAPAGGGGALGVAQKMVMSATLVLAEDAE